MTLRCGVAYGVSAFQEAGRLRRPGAPAAEMGQIHTDRQNYDTAEQLRMRRFTVCRKLGARRVIAQTEYELAKLYMQRGG